jgi:putative transmembrane protein PGPGW
VQSIIDLITWLDDNLALSVAVMVAWVVMLVVSLWAVHRFLITIPADYFSEEHTRLERWRDSHPALRWSLLIAKNLIGGFLVMAGIVMLFTPGQGILTLLLGLSLVDIPGKRALERRIVRRPSVLKVVNHMRAQSDRPPLQFSGQETPVG